MKKLITLAVAAAIAAPLAVSAETTLYGRLDNAIVHADDDTEKTWDVATNSSRIGVKGGEDLGNGLKAIFQAEWAFDSSENANASGSLGGGLSNRLAYVGLSGGFGTVAIGRQWTPYYGSVNKTDIFNNIASVASANGHYLGLTRIGNTVAYVSPNFSGFTAKVALISDMATGYGESDGVDAYNVSLDYNNGPISVGASFLELDDDIALTQDRWGLAASYNFGMFKVIAQYEDIDDAEGTKVGSGDEWGLAAEAYFGNNTVRALYAQQDIDDVAETDTWGIGFQHNFSKATRVYAEYYENDVDDGPEVSEFALGLRHDF